MPRLLFALLLLTGCPTGDSPPDEPPVDAPTPADQPAPADPPACDGVLQDGETSVDSPFDQDGDGYFDAGLLACAEAWAPERLDCNDLDAAVHPAAAEAVCNGIDDDCSVDTPDSVDADGDGATSCDDCADLDANRAPGLPELCDGVDNDCDGAPAVDEADADADGHRVCDGDCDDTDATRSPGEPELCNGVDDDCDGAPDPAESDGDLDDFSACGGDCEDGDPAVNPSAVEACNGTDDDCDGVVPADELDDDFDGFSACDGDCDDADPERAPNLADIPYDGLDQDCIGGDLDDVDGDGWELSDDCDDGDAAVNPDAVELDGDGIDNDCWADPPTIESAEIVPTSGDRTAEFECVLGAVGDPDGDLQSSGVVWMVDGVDVGLGNPIAAGTLQRGDELRCRAEAVDFGGTTAELLTDPLTVANAAPSLVVLAGIAAEGGFIDLQVTAEDADGDALALSATGLPPGAAFSDNADGTGSVAWSPALDAAGTYPLLFTADDGTDAVIVAHDLVVDPTDAPPSLLSHCEAELETGVEYRCALSATDPDGDAIVGFAVTDGPPGMTIDPSTDELVWTPTEADAGAWYVDVEAITALAIGTARFRFWVPEAALLAEAWVEPADGATLSGAGDLVPSFELVLPPGVFDVPTQVDVYELEGAPWAPVGAPAVRIEATEELDGVALLNIVYPDGTPLGMEDEGNLEVNYFNETHQAWVPVAGSLVDVTSNTVSAPLRHFSLFTVQTPTQRRLQQAAQLLYLDGECNPTDTFPWTSDGGADRNLLIPHGWTGFAWEPATDWTDEERNSGASACWQAAAQWGKNNLPHPVHGSSNPRMVYYQYPTGSSIDQNTQTLRALLNQAKSEHAEFDDSVIFHTIGFSMGGVVARGYARLTHPSAASGSTDVHREQLGAVITLNSPHLGTDISSFAGGMSSASPLEPDTWVDPSGLLAHGLALWGHYDAVRDDIWEEDSSVPWTAVGAVGLDLDAWLLADPNRPALHTGLVDMMKGMGVLQVGSAMEQDHPVYCIASQIGNIADPWHSLMQDYSENALEASDGAVPFRSQRALPYLWTQQSVACDDHLQYLSNFVHSGAVRDVLDDALDGTLLRANQDFCVVGEFDVGAKLLEWTGIGTNSCPGPGPAPSPPVLDFDDDGWQPPEDCNDLLWEVNPGRDEECDGLDNDCDGLRDEALGCDEDNDADGESPYSGDPDNDTGPSPDADDDGVTIAEGDCDDGSPFIAPGLPELPDGLDNDCDGEVDEVEVWAAESLAFVEDVSIDHHYPRFLVDGVVHGLATGDLWDNEPLYLRDAGAGWIVEPVPAHLRLPADLHVEPDGTVWLLATDDSSPIGDVLELWTRSPATGVWALDWTPIEAWEGVTVSDYPQVSIDTAGSPILLVNCQFWASDGFSYGQFSLSTGCDDFLELAVDAAGAPLVFYRQDNSHVVKMFSGTQQPSGAWSFTYSQPGVARVARVGLDPSGMWPRVVRGGYEPLAFDRYDGSVWTTSTIVTPYLSEYSSLSMAVLADDTICAVWLDTSYGNVKVSCDDGVTTWTDPLAPVTAPAFNGAALAARADGTVEASWSNRDTNVVETVTYDPGSRSVIGSSSFGQIGSVAEVTGAAFGEDAYWLYAELMSGQLPTELWLEHPGGTDLVAFGDVDQSSGSVAVESAQLVHVIWEQGTGLYYRVGTPGGTWAAPEAVPNADTSARAEVDVGASGLVAIAHTWSGQAYASFREAPGDPWTRVTIETGNGWRQVQAMLNSSEELITAVRRYDMNLYSATPAGRTLLASRSVTTLWDLEIDPLTDDPLVLANEGSETVLLRWNGVEWSSTPLPEVLANARMTAAPSGLVEVIGLTNTRDVVLYRGTPPGPWAVDVIDTDLPYNTTVEVVHRGPLGPTPATADGDGVRTYAPE